MSDAMDYNELPDLNDAMLSGEEIHRLFDDIERCTVVVSIVVKTGPRQHTPDAGVSLAQARTMLLEGEARGVQLRYQYQGEEYCDTLMRMPDGVRLVRIRR